MVVLRRRQGHRHQFQQLEQALMQREHHLSEAIDEQERLARHCAELLEYQQGLEKDLHHDQLCRHGLNSSCSSSSRRAASQHSLMTTIDWGFWLYVGWHI